MNEKKTNNKVLKESYISTLLKNKPKKRIMQCRLLALIKQKIPFMLYTMLGLE